MYHRHQMLDQRTLSITVTRFHGVTSEQQPDILAVEEPLEIRLGIDDSGTRVYRSVSVTMRTPGHDRELAAGFLFTEGILSSLNQIESVDSWGPLSSDGLSRNITKVDLKTGVTVDISRLERHFYTASSCGVCGKASLDAVRASACLARIPTELLVKAEVLHQLPGRLEPAQSDFALTGGLHAAALFSNAGDLLAVREDVGRHNAVDKLIGFHFLAQRPMSGVLLVSGRASFELVQKAIAAGIPILAAVGAPSSLAVELAEEFNLTLIGFLRNHRFNIYCGESRIVS